MKKIYTLPLVAALSLNACAPMKATRGNIVEDARQAEIKEGVTTRDQVFRILGSPTTVSPFDNNVWYYMGQKTEKRGIFDPEVVEEKIVAVTFDQAGVVQSIKSMDNARLDIPVKDKKTPTYGNDVSAIQQIFGNLGKFNPEQPQ